MRVGVTGIFASGKGTVCAMFEKLGAFVVDTDVIAKEIMEPGQRGLAAVTDAFGPSFLNTDGSLNRREFANFVFADKGRVKLLNSITHPIIHEQTMSQSSGDGIFMLNVPLLFETGLDRLMDYTIVVFTEKRQAVERGVKRDNISKKEIKDRLRHQITLNKKKAMADYVIDNSGSPENTERQVFKIWNILTANRLK